MAVTVYSDDIEANLPPLYSPIKPNRQEGRVRTANFKWTCASEASGTTVAVVKLPRGARILGGQIAASATLANSATLAVGIAAVDGSGNYDDALARVGSGLKTDDSAVTVGTPVADSTTAFKAAAAQGATQVPFAITRALGYLYETAKEVYITLTTGTGAVTTEVVTGDVRYVVD